YKALCDEEHTLDELSSLLERYVEDRSSMRRRATIQFGRRRAETGPPLLSGRNHWRTRINSPARLAGAQSGTIALTSPRRETEHRLIFSLLLCCGAAPGRGA